MHNWARAPFVLRRKVKESRRLVYLMLALMCLSYQEECEERKDSQNIQRRLLSLCKIVG